MAVKLKTPEQIQQMKHAGQIVRHVLNRLGEMITPGVTTEDLNAEAERICLQRGAECLFKGVPGRGGAGPFPGVICASINEEIVHGIPSPDRSVADGDIVSIDFGVRLNGWCGDAAQTYVVGQTDPRTQKLVDVTRRALEVATEQIRPGRKWSQVARAMQDCVESAGFCVVTDFVGHGIGREMHEDPKVPNYVSRELLRKDIELAEGLVLAVEPMVNTGTSRVKLARDGWTALTGDGLPSAHFENTLAVTADGVDVLTG